MDNNYTFYLQDFYSYVVVFVRFAGFFSFAPIFSENRVNMQIRLLLTLFTTIIITPSVSQYLPREFPQNAIEFDLIIITELFLGIFAGLIGRILMAALDVAGALIGFQMSLANAFAQSAATSQQVGLPAVYISMIAVLLIFITDFHHVMIKLIIESYSIFQPGSISDITTLTGDMAQTITKYMSASFLLGLQIGAPVTIMGLLMFAAAGIVNRLVPQIQVFFILQPLQIMLGFIVLTMSIGLLMSYFIRDFSLKYQAIWNMG